MKTPRCVDNDWCNESTGQLLRGAECCVGLLGRWRPISSHLRHARLANRRSYWQPTVEPQLARNSARYHPESFMNYPG